jgi:hypothetical protein
MASGQFDVAAGLSRHFSDDMKPALHRNQSTAANLSLLEFNLRPGIVNDEPSALP